MYECTYVHRYVHVTPRPWADYTPGRYMIVHCSRTLLKRQYIKYLIHLFCNKYTVSLQASNQQAKSSTVYSFKTPNSLVSCLVLQPATRFKVIFVNTKVLVSFHNLIYI